MSIPAGGKDFSGTSCGEWASQVALVVKYLADEAGGIRVSALIAGSGRSPGGGHEIPFQYSCLENPMDRGT